jgi:hypothetical protein
MLRCFCGLPEAVLSLGVDVDVKLGQKRSCGVAEDRPTITCFFVIHEICAAPENDG